MGGFFRIQAQRAPEVGSFLTIQTQRARGAPLGPELAPQTAVSSEYGHRCSCDMCRAQRAVFPGWRPVVHVHGFRTVEVFCTAHPSLEPCLRVRELGPDACVTFSWTPEKRT